ncbi:unnamed protein product [Euphydryas editha]|uniref:Uncharacterized protein n=1 Tax=Euphydryas editha TaxID=104508 RepID=A0AAU9U354_EUPED|nr:unnamed protein product [Euphydryas editha]
MNCLSPRSRRRKQINEASTMPCYPQQPPYNPEYIFGNIENKANLVTSWGVSYSLQYTVTSCEGKDNSGGRGRRSLYEGVNWMPVSAQVYPLVSITTHALTALTHLPCCCMRVTRCSICLKCD